MAKSDIVNRLISELSAKKPALSASANIDVKDEFLPDEPQNALDYIPSVYFGCVFDPAAVSAPPGWSITWCPSAPLVQIDPEDPESGFYQQLPQIGDMWEMRTIPYQTGIAGQISRDFDLESWPLSLGVLAVPAVPEVLEGLDALYECGVVHLTDREYQGDSPYEIEYRAIIAARQTGGGP